ncbi:MAG TPA: S8 family serine peptidase [Burkholderiales bacterium]
MPQQIHTPVQINPGAVKALLPDLAIERIAVTASCQVVVTVSNRGSAPLPDSVWTAVSPASASVYLTVNGQPWGGQTIWKFDPARALQKPGGTASVTLSYKVNGTVTVKATVDHTRQVAEADESNNARTTTLTCGAPATIDRSNVVPAGGSLERAAAEPEPAPEFAPAASDPVPAAPGIPSGGGSLLDAPLPPPPPDVPPPPEREDQTVEPAEIVVASANMQEAQALAQLARGLGFGIRRRSNLQGLGLVVTVLRVPRDTSVGSALAALRQAAPSVWADANHRYSLQGDAALAYGRALVGWANVAPQCGKGVRIGMLDTALATAHPALQGRDIVTRSVLPAGIPRAKPDHGTAIAALLVGNTLPSGFGGMVPAAKLYAAEIFRARGEQSDTTAEWIVAALDWLAAHKVHVVNLSLGGPRNLLLEAAIGRLLGLGVAVVAAGGNGGPDAPPVYPAAQRGVVAVTAVDADLKPYRKATRGAYLAFAAPGVDVWSAAPDRGGAYFSGTSYAAPFVTAVLAAERQKAPRMAWAKLIEQAGARARDLGVPGRDPVYGWGLVQAGACREATARR